MRALAAALAAALLLPGAASAQAAAPRHEVALEAGFLSAGLSYARGLAGTPLSVGAGVWGAWEPPSTFDRNVWEPLGATVFGRYRAAPWLHADLGLTAARYLWADDCGECSGTFAGLRLVTLLGYRALSAGPEITAGWASDDRNGSAFGVLWGGQLRLSLRWGR